MYVDSLGNVGVTANPQKVRPGMIYVDISNSRNRREIYKAYMNGASLIYTQQNVSDPDLPVVKVNNPQETLVTLLERFFVKPENLTRLVAVLGNDDRSVLLEMIESILYGNRHLKSDGLKGLEHIPYTGKPDIEEIFARFSDLTMGANSAIPVALSTNPKILNYFKSFNFDSAIITDIGLSEYSGENHKNIKTVKEFLSKIIDKKTIIINNDEPYAIKAVELCNEIIPITYGLNKKAAVTASSIDIDEMTRFNYCVQRSFRTRSGKLIEPFEMPIAMRTIGNHNIYNALAAITCGLYYDTDMNRIKNSVGEYSVPERHFEKIFEIGFTIIDNYCDTPPDFKAAFESIQILSYENLYLVISVNQDSNMHIQRDKVQMISEWAKMLKCREVILTSCMDGDKGIEEFPLKNIRIYKRVLKEHNILFRYYHLLQHSLEHALSNIKKGDLLILLGGDEMNKAKKLVKHYLNSTEYVKH